MKSWQKDSLLSRKLRSLENPLSDGMAPSYYSIVKDSSAVRGVNLKFHQNSPIKLNQMMSQLYGCQLH